MPATQTDYKQVLNHVIRKAPVSSDLDHAFAAGWLAAFVAQLMHMNDRQRGRALDKLHRELDQ